MISLKVCINCRFYEDKFCNKYRLNTEKDYSCGAFKWGEKVYGLKDYWKDEQEDEPENE
jgi:hypothetical protein